MSAVPPWEHAPETPTFVTWVPEFVTREDAARLTAAAGAAVADGTAKRSEWTGPLNPDLGSGSGRLASWVSTETTPELLALYEQARSLAAHFLRRPVTLSPYRSAVTVKVYDVGDEQNWHRDSNPVSALLLLDGPGPEFEDPGLSPGGRTPGTLLLFSGRNLVHRVPPCQRPKTSVVFNLYHPDDHWRPAGLDALIYGNA